MFAYFCLGTIDLESILFNLSRQLAKQEAITDHLLSRVMSLEETSIKNEMLLTSFREQLNGQHYRLASASHYKGPDNYATESDGSSDPKPSKIRYCLKEKPSSAQSSSQHKKSLATYIYDSDSSVLVKSSNNKRKALKSSCADTSSQVPQDYLCLSTASSEDGSSSSEYYFDSSDSFNDTSRKSQLESSGYGSSISKKCSPKNSFSADLTTPTASSPPIASPIVLSQKATSLSSSEIDKSYLLPIEDVVKKYRSKSPHILAVKLAFEAIFGQVVLAKCSPMGKGKTSRPALPTEELNQIKQIVLNSYPGYWGYPHEFEKLWKKKIMTSIGAECCRARSIVRSQVVNQ